MLDLNGQVLEFSQKLSGNAVTQVRNNEESDKEVICPICMLLLFCPLYA